MIVETPVDYDVVDGDTRQKGVSDFAESRISVMPTTQYLHNEDTGSYGVDVARDGVLEGERISLTNQLACWHKTTNDSQRSSMVTGRRPHTI